MSFYIYMFHVSSVWFSKKELSVRFPQNHRTAGFRCLNLDPERMSSLRGAVAGCAMEERHGLADRFGLICCLIFSAIFHSFSQVPAQSNLFRTLPSNFNFKTKFHSSDILEIAGSPHHTNGKLQKYFFEMINEKETPHNKSSN